MNRYAESGRPGHPDERPLPEDDCPVITTDTAPHHEAASRAIVHGGPAPEHQLDAWAAAVEHLHALGLPAAVPELAARQLRRRGIRADWGTAA